MESITINCFLRGRPSTIWILTWLDVNVPFYRIVGSVGGYSEHVVRLPAKKFRCINEITYDPLLTQLYAQVFLVAAVYCHFKHSDNLSFTSWCSGRMLLVSCAISCVLFSMWCAPRRAQWTSQVSCASLSDVDWHFTVAMVNYDSTIVSWPLPSARIMSVCCTAKSLDSFMCPVHLRVLHHG